MKTLAEQSLKACEGPQSDIVVGHQPQINHHNRTNRTNKQNSELFRGDSVTLLNNDVDNHQTRGDIGPTLKANNGIMATVAKVKQQIENNTEKIHFNSTKASNNAKQFVNNLIKNSSIVSENNVKHQQQPQVRQLNNKVEINHATAASTPVKRRGTRTPDCEAGKGGQVDVAAGERVTNQIKQDVDKSRLVNQQKQPQQTSQQQGREGGEPGLAKKVVVECLMLVVRSIMTMYDIISVPIFYFKHNVQAKRHEVEQIRSVKDDPSDPNSPWQQINIPHTHRDLEAKIDSFETYDELLKNAFKVNADSLCYGYRQVLHEQWTKRPDSDKLFKQVRLSGYKWCTYGQFERQIEAARVGFLVDGVRAGDKVILFADTRAEWQIVAQSLIRLGAVVCTMYSTLGVDGIVHTMNETQAALVVTQSDKVDRLLGLKHRLPSLRRVVYFDLSLQLPSELGGGGVLSEDEKPARVSTEQDAKFADNCTDQIECRRFCKLLENGLKADTADVQRLNSENEAARTTNESKSIDGTINSSVSKRRRKDQIAVIMYTSGSTGIPKGVLISHGNIMATIKSFSYVTKDFVNEPKRNTCCAYLPSAHIFEFCIESTMLYHGVKFGFATPHTLTDKSPGLLAGEKGDLTLLSPTIMIIVPLVLDRIVQGVKQTLKLGPYFKEKLVNHLINYKIYWQQRHFDTPLVNKIVCSKIAAALGGKAKFVICGSAPLSPQTQVFVRAALNLNLPQGFGTTETCAATSCQLFDDQSTQNVGLPEAGCKIKLEPWLEGNYRPDDKPNPRGEIVVGGEFIAQGYFKLEEQTKEAFYVDKQGTRWYKTGDIGEILPNGQLKIIDRKKDLVKLQNGEYISLGRVESTLKSNPFTDNFCVYVNSNYNYVVALGPANEAAIKTLAKDIVNDYEQSRSSSPIVSKRLTVPQSTGLGRDMSAASISDMDKQRQERESLLLSEDEHEMAIDELKELLASYECDRLNNNAETTIEARQVGQVNECDDRLVKLCANRLVVERVLSQIHKMARERNLLSLEVPRKLLLIAEEWTEDKNLVTAAMKIRRNFIYKRYEQELEQMYAPQSVSS